MELNNIYSDLFIDNSTQMANSARLFTEALAAASESVDETNTSLVGMAATLETTAGHLDSNTVLVNGLAGGWANLAANGQAAAAGLAGALNGTVLTVDGLQQALVGVADSITGQFTALIGAVKTTGSEWAAEFADMRDKTADATGKMAQQLDGPLTKKALPSFGKGIADSAKGLVSFTVSSAAFLKTGGSILGQLQGLSQASNQYAIVKEKVADGIKIETLASYTNVSAQQIEMAAKEAGLKLDRDRLWHTETHKRATKEETMAVLANSGALSTKNIITAALTGQIGFATAAQLLWNSSLLANPVVLVAAALAGFVAVVVGATKAAMDSAAANNAYNVSYKDLSNTIKENAAAYQDTVDAIDLNSASISNMIDELYELESSGEDIGRMRVLAELLNDSFDGLNMTIDDTGNVLGSSRDEMNRLLQLQSKEERAAEAKKRLLEIEQEREIALEGYNSALADQEAAQDRLTGSNTWAYALGGSMDYLNLQLISSSAAVEGFEEQLEALRLEAEALGEDVLASADAQNEAARVWVAANGEIVASEDEMIAKNAELRQAIEDFKGSVVSMYDVLDTESDKSLTTQAANFASNVDIHQQYVEDLAYMRQLGLHSALVETLEGASEEEIATARAYAEQLRNFEALSEDERNRIREMGAEERARLGYADVEEINKIYEEGYDQLQQIGEERLLGPDFTSLGSDAMDEMAALIGESSSVAESVEATIENAHSTGLAAVEKQNFSLIGQAMTQGIIRGIEQGRSGLVNAMVSSARSAFNETQGYLQINSPSKLMRRVIGEGMMEGWIQGIERQSGNLEDTMRATAGASVEAAEGYTPQFRAALAPLQTVPAQTQNHDYADLKRAVYDAICAGRQKVTLEMDFKNMGNSDIARALLPHLKQEVWRQGVSLVST